MNININGKNFSWSNFYFLFNETKIFTYYDIWKIIKQDYEYGTNKMFRGLTLITSDVTLKQNNVVIDNFKNRDSNVIVHRDDIIDITLQVI